MGIKFNTKVSVCFEYEVKRRFLTLLRIDTPPPLLIFKMNLVLNIKCLVAPQWLSP